MKRTYNISFQCYYPERGNYTTHKQVMQLKDIAKWIEAYTFTHPNVQSISVKIWMDERVSE